MSNQLNFISPQRHETAKAPVIENPDSLPTLQKSSLIHSHSSSSNTLNESSFHHNLDIEIIKIKEHQAIICDNSNGPTFGGGFDFDIINNSNENEDSLFKF